MTFDDRTQAVQAFGFSPRQAQFLAHVVLHSGFCLRRQYTAFSGTQNGKNVQHFLERLVAHRVAARCTYRADRGHVYHVQHRGVYRALGVEHDRNRKAASPARIARKLMLLDVVLGEPTAAWVATEADKVALFTERFGVAREDLPRRSLVATGANPATTHYFFEKLPIAVCGTPPTVHFVYLTVDGSGPAFDRFLHAHGRLLGALSAWAIVVAHPPSVNPTPLHEVFHHFVGDDLVLSEARLRDLERYFVARRAVERNEWAQLSLTDLQTFRATRLAFAEPRIEVLFGRWLASGASRLEANLLSCSGPRPGILVPRPLPHTYQQFGAYGGML